MTWLQHTHKVFKTECNLEEYFAITEYTSTTMKSISLVLI